MRKMQVLFPEPQINRLKRIAEQEDRPVSELIRAAVDLWLSRQGNVRADHIRESVPAYHCGNVLKKASEFREMANLDRTEST